MRLRFIGIAMSVPSAARSRVHTPTPMIETCSPLGLSAVTESMSSAGIAETIALPVA